MINLKTLFYCDDKLCYNQTSRIHTFPFTVYCLCLRSPVLVNFWYNMTLYKRLFCHARQTIKMPDSWVLSLFDLFFTWPCPGWRQTQWPSSLSPHLPGTALRRQAGDKREKFIKCQWTRVKWNGQCPICPIFRCDWYAVSSFWERIQLYFKIWIRVPDTVNSAMDVDGRNMI